MTDAATALAEPGMGHNQPLPLRDQLAEQHAPITERVDALAAGVDRTPDITDEDLARKAGDFVKQLAAEAKAIEAKRVDVKQPYREAAEQVDAFFKPLVDRLTQGADRVRAKLGVYLRQKEAAERQRREEQARREREEAARLAAEAEKANSNERMAAAAALETQAAQTQASAQVKPAELSRTRGDFGSVSGLKSQWTFRDLDRATINLEKLRPYIPQDGLEKAVRAAIRAGSRAGSIEGVVIFEEHVAAVR